ncbi:gliding motility-associated C-terminal domain-containing protein [Lutibacter sp. A80]|uniref:T9SS type B sorting domain-containing protein n=1 Tax=Lutibacter sp. A80 TaxID=2918453 RepID=UPI001F066668|nr:gliding motility-associated C-terminal domain-containing protein [Lutibacter sp. A80]UMB62231.1 gliding motility-associated C-terminal domain-containing protein [Lutibacter sp. A80]
MPVPSITVTDVSIDSDGDVIGFTVPGEGTWSVHPISGEITFTPLSTFNDDPTVIEYTIKDNDGNKSNNATVTIDYVPVATDDYSTPGNVPLTSVSVNVSDNDLDGDIVDPSTIDLDPSSPLTNETILVVSGEGTWEITASGVVTFTPESIANGDAADYTLDPTPIPYTIKDDEGNTSNEAFIHVDYAPIATDDVDNNGNEGYPANETVTVDVLDNDTTGDTYDPTTVSLVDPGTAINIVTDANGDITSYEIPGEGTWNVDLVTGEITFDPEDGFILSPTPITYNVEDDEGNQSNDALVTIIYIAQADIQVVKTDNSDTYTPGLPLVYTITVTNNGPADAAGVIVNDDIISNLEAVTTWTGNGSSGSGDIVDTITTLNSGDTVTYTVTINVPSGYTGDIVNTASAALPESNGFNEPVDPDPSNNSSTDVDEMYAQAALVVEKRVDNATPEVGSEVTFTITVTNEGPSDATNIDVLDVLPTGYTLSPDPNPITVSQGDYHPSGPTTGLWDLGDLVDGSVATLTIRAVVNESGIYTNTAEVVYADQDDPNSIHGNNDPEEDDQDEATTTPLGVTDLVTTKTVDNSNPNEGDIVKYTITVVNNGPSVATGVSLIDNLPAGLEYVTHVATGGSVNTYADIAGNMTWTIGIIDIGESATLTLDALVTAQGTFDQTPITNIIDNPASGDQLDPTTDGDDLEEEIVVTSSDLVTIKTVSNPNPVEGETITYSIAVTNYGPSIATNVSLVDLLPAGVTYVGDNQSGAYNSGDGNWMVGSIDVGKTVTLNIVATVDEDTSGQRITNVTTAASGDQTDPDTTTEGFPEDDLDADIDVENYADVVLTKVVDNATPNAGDTVTYTVTVRNNGPAKVTGLLVTDALPTGLTYANVMPSDGTWTAPNWSIDLLESGEEETIVIEAIVGMDQGGQTLTNIVSNTQDQVDSDLTEDDDRETIVVTSSDLVTVKTVSDPTPSEGDVITYTIAVTNNGPSDATGVSLTDLLPAGVTYVSDDQGDAFNSGSGIWTIGAIANGVTATLNITATVDVDTAGTFITNATTAATGDQTDPSTAGDELEATIEVENYADIVLTKVVDNATPNVGDIVTYVITVTNNGPAKVTNLVVTDALPTGLTYVPNGAMPSDGTWTAPNWNVDLLESGEFETLVIEALVGMDQGGMTLTNIVSNTQDQVDSNLTEDDDNETIVVTSSDLVTVKTVSDPTPNEGDTITYSIAVTNNGPSDATGVSLVDLLPAGVTYVSDNQSGGYNSGDGNWNIGTIANGATATLNITATVAIDTAGETITNITTAATGDQSDPTTEGDDLDAIIIVENHADIVLTKVVDNATPNAGDTVTYTVTVRNNGPAKVTNLVVTDALPAGLTYANVMPSDGTWNAPNWKVDLLESGEEETIVIEAIVGMDQGGMTLINTVSNTQDQIDSNLTEDDANATIVVTSSDLATVKTVSNATPNEGDTITYTIAVTNNGPSAATGVSLIDNLPVGVTYVSNSTASGTYNYGSGLWTIGELANGATATLNITATVNDGTLGQTITNTTRAVIADQSDSDTTNNVGSVSIVPTAYIDLSLTKTVVDDVVNPEVGDMISFEIRVNNDGPTEATGVQVTDLIPSGYDFVNYSQSIGIYDPITGIWDISFIEVGNTAVLIVDVIVMESGDYLNIAEITAANEIDVDSTPNNGDVNEDDYDSASVPPYQELDLKVEKTVMANNIEPLVGDVVSFEIRLINGGTIDGTEVVVTDLLPTGYTYVTHGLSKGVYDYETGKWIVGTILNGETETLFVDAIVNAAGDYLNCAEITEMHQIDTDLSNNTSCIATDPIKVIDLELTKEVDLSLGNQGPVSTTGVLQPYAETNVDFTITVSNNGPSDATGVQVVDLLPTGYNFVSVNVSTGSYDDGSGVWTLGTVLNGASETMVITAYVNPLGDWLNVAEITAANELDIDSTPNNDDIFEDDMDQIATEPIIPLTIPEGFTPNGDGVNDVFEIEYLEVLYPNFSMEIVNRYGNKVYEYKHDGNPYQTPEWWDGYSTGRWNFTNDQLPTGTYFYTIYFNNDERKPQTGWIYLRK